MIYLVIIVLIVLTLRFLPFISLEASLALQFWIKNLQKKIEEKISDIERKDRDR